MTSPLTPVQISVLAPDASAARAGQELADPRKWKGLGRNEQALWGLCQGSGANPYQAEVDMKGPAFHCTCPSHKHPCKHGLGLYLLFASQPALFAEEAPPAWVQEWLASRSRRAERAPKAEATPKEGKEGGSERSARKGNGEQRQRRVAEGISDLETWLRDLVRKGLASTQGQPYSYWDGPAARLVDAQAPGLARMLRQMAGTAASGEGWAERLLEQVARLHLLVEGYKRMEALHENTQADIRSLIGWTQSQDEILAQEGVRDRWLVLGQRVEEEDRLKMRRVWLHGLQTSTVAYLLYFAYGNQPLEPGFAPGTIVEATVAFFPGTPPRRGIIKERHGAAGTISTLEGRSLPGSIDTYATALTSNPWVETYPLLMSGVVPQPGNPSWRVRDKDGNSLPISNSATDGWALAAVTGGHQRALFGEWNGKQLRYLYSMSSSREQADEPPDPQPGDGLHSRIWDELAASALLGTERRAFSPKSLEGNDSPLCQLLAQIDPSDPESALLSAAAVVSLYRRAGQLPAKVSDPLPEPCPPEQLPYCSQDAVGRLQLMMSGQYTDLVPEWLGLVTKARRIVPPGALPYLLQLATVKPELRDTVLAATGERGRWLAAQNPEWAPALHSDRPSEQEIESTWQTGDNKARENLLRRVRNSDPAQGREMLAGTWNQERASERTSFLAALEIGLSMDDEPFLESALDDRSKEVRARAADLLASISGSRLVQRMTARALPLLRFEDGQKRGLFGLGRGSKPHIEVTLPETCDAAMARDGVTEISRDQTGKRAGWLSSLISTVPPGTWCDAWGKTPEEILDAAGEDRTWTHVLTQAWIVATVRHRDEKWAEVLTRRGFYSGASARRHLTSVVPPNRLESLIADRLRSTPEALFARESLLPALWQIEPPWSMELSRAVLAAAASHILAGGQISWEVQGALPAFGRCMAPQIVGEAPALLHKVEQVAPHWASSFERFASTLQFRADMYRELSPGG